MNEIISEILDHNPSLDHAYAEYRKGLQLKHLRETPGYTVLLDVMEAHCAQTEARLLDSNDPDPLAVFGLQKEAKAVRSFFHEIQERITYYISLEKPDLEA